MLWLCQEKSDDGYLNKLLTYFIIRVLHLKYAQKLIVYMLGIYLVVKIW